MNANYVSFTVFFVVGESPTAEFYVPTFRNTLSHLHRWCKQLTPPMKMEATECSETSAHKIQTPGIHPEERMQHSEHGESLKSRIFKLSVEARTILSRNLTLCQRPYVTYRYRGVLASRQLHHNWPN